MKRWIFISASFLFIFGGSFILDSCRKNRSRPYFSATPLNFKVPPGFPAPAYDFSAHPTTVEGFALGRKLFYDNLLSVDGTVSCGTCHQPIAAFTTFEHDRSHGVHHTHTLRNAPGLFNLAWYPYFFQDGSALSLQDVYQKHIASPTEFGETGDNILNKLKQNVSYKTMFNAAFGDTAITAERMYNALSQFVISLVSADSKFDKVYQGKASFTAQEQNGYSLFSAKCAFCHDGILLTDFSFRSNGLDVDPILNDYGRMRVTGQSSDSLKFRVPSLRNLAFTSYYMHDGRLDIPRNVLKYYETGIHQNGTLDPLLANGVPLTLSEEEDLLAFLRTLSDSTFLNNPLYRQ